MLVQATVGARVQRRVRQTKYLADERIYRVHNFISIFVWLRAQWHTGSHPLSFQYYYYHNRNIGCTQMMSVEIGYFSFIKSVFVNAPAIEA